jgi:hypothetical protein
LSQGVEWKALINRYISVIPLIGDEVCIAMQSISGWPLKKPVHKAMIANVGAAARPSHRAMLGAALPPPAQVSTSSGTTGEIDISVMAVPVVVAPPDTRFVAALGGAVEPLIHAPQVIQTARVGRVGVVDNVVF